MANTDSFIDEVTEEVRKDRLFKLLRRWGWVAILAVLLLVGGAAWTEWQRSRDAAEAQAFGDAILAAAAEGEPSAFDAVPTATEEQAVLLAFLRSATAEEIDAAGLIALGERDDLPQRLRHLALLKGLMAGGSGDAERDAAILTQLAEAGAPFRFLAIERQAHAALASGDEDEAVALLTGLTEEAGVPEALRRRATQTMVALGVVPDPT
ncbi:hypothetical protein [Jannaschia aquimarina]|uniref:Tetratricopeptide repeat-like domain-containing protein n=1 Tax=Jannaschia aquimarina TaxID=935700 RepID=A0A0D1EFP6_9RHOB|nr:hypothetical protein [Jannaschia aquimarina]KIT14695.1 hypothetical protein jaqu_36370 [Jannaschia aquimarina]SNT38263.1 hypothetical protein SAMN05421775_113125 [Jannaschia aquimarina]